MADVPKMEYNFLSRNCGLKVSNICLGTATFGEDAFIGGQTEEEAHLLLDKFVEFGGNFIDTANEYSHGRSEEYIGTWMKKRSNRDQMVIATKCRSRTDKENPNGEGLSRKHVMLEVETSLGRLQTDYIDLYQIHYWDDGTPLKEVLSVMNDLVRRGKVRYVGASNLTGWQLQKIVDLNHHLGYQPWVTLQQEYSLLDRKSELEQFQVCRRQGLGILAYSPLKSGLLTGKYKDGEEPPEGTRYHSFKKINNEYVKKRYLKWLDSPLLKQVMDTMGTISQDTDKSRSQVALRWLLQKPSVTSVIVGARTVGQLEDNMAASAGWQLTDEQQIRQLDAVTMYELGSVYMVQEAFLGSRKKALPGEV